MKRATKILTIIVIGVAGVALITQYSPLFLDSKIEHFNEDNLPTVSIENGTEVYCRMQADDFRLILPKGSEPHDLKILTSGYDSIEGSLTVSFPKNAIEASDYQQSVLKTLPLGGYIIVSEQANSSNLEIKFNYFGDR